MLLVLMIVELAYTVILSLRGTVLRPSRSCSSGLIAVIRRILVITIGEVNPNKLPAVNPSAAWSLSRSNSAILTAVVLALVVVDRAAAPPPARARPALEVGFATVAPH